MINHFYTDPSLMRRLDRIEEALYRVLGEVNTMAVNFAEWEAELTGITDGVSAVEVLIQKIVDELRAGSAADQVKIQQFTTQLSNLKSRLAAAAVANTPAS